MIQFLVKIFSCLIVTVVTATIFHVFLLPLFFWRHRFGPFCLKLYSRMILFVFRVRVTVKGPTDQAIADHPVILIANHVSFLDIPIMSAIYRANFVSKKEVVYYPFVGTSALLLGVHFLKRGSMSARIDLLRVLSKEILAGDPVVVFPQGTTASKRNPKPFHRGLFKVVELNPKVALAPITLDYHQDDTVAWGNESIIEVLLKTCRLSHVDVTVTSHPLITIADYEGRSATEVTAFAQGLVFSGLTLLPPKAKS